MCRSFLRLPMGSFYLLVQWFLRGDLQPLRQCPFPENFPFCALCLYSSSSLFHFISLFFFGLCWVFIACGKWGLLCIAVHRLLIVVAYLVEHRLQACRLQQLWSMGLVAPRHVESSWTRDQICVPALAGELLTSGPPGKVPITLIIMWDLKFFNS